MSVYAHRTFQPHPVLRDYIECYEVDQKEGPLDRPLPRRIMPDGSSHLIFYVYGSHGDVLRGPYSPADCRLRYVGARSIYKDIDQRRRVLTLIVRFRPGGAVPFFQIPAVELADLGFNLDVLWGTESALLVERLTQEPDVVGQIRVLEDAFIRKLTGAPPLDLVVQEAIRRLNAAHGPPPLKVLAGSLGISERHLRNKFRDAVGLSPKTYARIVRVQHAIDLAAQEASPAWPSLALAVGFFDQAHMIHDFQALLGESPGRFMRRL